MNPAVSDAEISALSTAPRITQADLEATIASEHYFTAEQGVIGAMSGPPPGPALARITICALVLRNGFTSVGINEGPVSAANFDPEIGKRMAREDALEKLWPLLGYQLKEQLYQRTQPAVAPVWQGLVR